MNSPFNTPLETGTRMLFVFDASPDERFDLQRLVFLDYLLVNSGDFPGAPPSLHPATPGRSGAWIVRRRAVASGLDLMFAKELVEKHFTASGISYSASELTGPFLAHLTSAYATHLRTIAAWLAAHVVTMAPENLRDFMERHVGEWGAEFRLDLVGSEADE